MTRLHGQGTYRLMKPGEKDAILVGILINALLAAYKVLYSDARKYRKWQECAGDVQQFCAKPPGQGPTATLTLKCLIANFPGLKSSCKQFITTKYKPMLDKQQETVRRKGARPQEPAAPFDLQSFLAQCNPFWSEECKQENDKTGQNVACFPAQANFSKFSRECLEVMVEVVQWAPKECVQTPIMATCKASVGASRLACLLKNRPNLPPSCSDWLTTVEKIHTMVQKNQ